MAAIILEWEGTTYEVDLNSITPKEFRQIKTHLGLKAGAFVRSFADPDDIDADAIVALLWLGEKRAGVANPQFKEDVPWLELIPAIQRVEGDEPEDQEAPKAGS